MRVANALLSDFSEFPVDHPVYHYGRGLITSEDITRWFFYRCHRGVLVHRIMKMHPRQVPKKVCVFRSIHFFFFLRLCSVEKDWPHIGIEDAQCWSCGYFPRDRDVIEAKEGCSSFSHSDHLHKRLFLSPSRLLWFMKRLPVILQSVPHSLSKVLPR